MPFTFFSVISPSASTVQDCAWVKMSRMLPAVMLDIVSPSIASLLDTARISLRIIFRYPLTPALMLITGVRDWFLYTYIVALLLVWPILPPAAMFSIYASIAPPCTK